MLDSKQSQRRKLNMFEIAELGRKVRKRTFKAEEPGLHTALLRAQFALRDAKVPVIIIASGVEGAGKGAVVNRLHKWLDTRGVATHPLWDETDEERERPAFWRFWRVMPARGTIAILFGSWYTHPIADRALKRIGKSAFQRRLHRIVELERLLVDDGALIVKFWFHLTHKQQRKQLKKDDEAGVTSPHLEVHTRRHKHFRAAAEQAIRITDEGIAPWHIIEAKNSRYRDLAAGRILLAAMEKRLDDLEDGAGPAPMSAPPMTPAAADVPTVLDTVRLDRSLSSKTYSKRLDRHQTELRKLAWEAHAQGRNTVMVFEGWDAAGKGGAIRRLTAAMDARLFRVISIGAPTDEEQAHHYLWRFWRHVPRAGYMTLYDRSWYGRVLVERVERFATVEQWARAYQEINDFEEQLADHGVVLLKFWLHVSPEKQLERFRERERQAWKQHKLTVEDWRNRERWDAYRAAVHDMVARTSTVHAPWHLIGADDKRAARIEVIETVCERLDEALS